MATVIRFSERRVLAADLPANAVQGDLDLLPTAVVLWLGSVARVVVGALEGETPDVEATLAFLCVVLIPCWLFWEWIRSGDGAPGSDPPPTGRNSTLAARIVPLRRVMR